MPQMTLNKFHLNIYLLYGFIIQRYALEADPIFCDMRGGGPAACAQRSLTSQEMLKKLSDYRTEYVLAATLNLTYLYKR